MNIETVKITEGSYLINGSTSVPITEGNRHYQVILDWINEGNLPEGPDVIEPSYVELRAAEYPSMATQLDMQYWDGINGTTVWQDTIDAIKAKYPKTITGGTTIGDVPQALLDAAAEKKLLAEGNTIQEAEE